MRRTLSFTKKNFIKVIRAPIFFVVALVFPILYILLLTVIFKSVGGTNPEDINQGNFLRYPATVPGAMVLASCLVMYFMASTVSKERKSLTLKRLYASPMRTPEFLTGYAVVGFALGIAMFLVTYFGGWIIAACFHDDYIPFGKGMLLIVSQMPIMLTLLFFGIIIGSFIAKGAPGICAIMIVCVGIVGGCFWVLDVASNGLQTFCRCLPFYPSVYIGRAIVGAKLSFKDNQYVWNSICNIGIGTIFAYLVVNIALANILFTIQSKRNMKE